MQGVVMLFLGRVVVHKSGTQHGIFAKLSVDFVLGKLKILFFADIFALKKADLRGVVDGHKLGGADADGADGTAFNLPMLMIQLHTDFGDFNRNKGGGFQSLLATDVL